MITPLHAILLIPAVAVVLLALIPSYRIGAFLNMLAAGLTFMAGASLLFQRRTAPTFSSSTTSTSTL